MNQIILLMVEVSMAPELLQTIVIFVEIIFIITKRAENRSAVGRIRNGRRATIRFVV